MKAESNARFCRIQDDQSLKLVHEAGPHTPSSLLLLQHTGPHQSVDHVVELAHTHATPLPPLLPLAHRDPFHGRVGGRACVVVTDMLPEAFRLVGESRAFPEDPAEHLEGVGRYLASFEYERRLVRYDFPSERAPLLSQGVFLLGLRASGHGLLSELVPV